MLLFCVKTVVKESFNFEMANLKKKMKKKERKTFLPSGNFLVRYFCDSLFCTTRRVVGHEALKNEWYIVIKVYKLLFLRFYHILCFPNPYI